MIQNIIFRPAAVEDLVAAAAWYETHSTGRRSDRRDIGGRPSRARGLTRMFDELSEAFDKNIKAIEHSKGMLNMGGLDPVEALVVSQNQMKMLAQQILRSANVGIGYAVSIEHIAADSVFAF